MQKKLPGGINPNVEDELSNHVHVLLGNGVKEWLSQWVWLTVRCQTFAFGDLDSEQVVSASFQVNSHSPVRKPLKPPWIPRCLVLVIPLGGIAIDLLKGTIFAKRQCVNPGPTVGGFPHADQVVSLEARLGRGIRSFKADRLSWEREQPKTRARATERPDDYDDHKQQRASSLTPFHHPPSASSSHRERPRLQGQRFSALTRLDTHLMARVNLP